MNRAGLLLGIALSVAGWTTARANFITTLTAATSPQPGGLTRYSYVLTNNAASDLNAAGLGITVSSSAALQSITGPEGWDITYFPRNTLVTWESSDITTYFVAPGSSETFSFESALGPIPQPYLITGLDITGTQFDINTGQIAGPGISIVPEPGSLLLLGLGLVGVLAYGLMQRRAVAA